MHHPPFRRRQVVVDRPFQRSLCLHGVGLGLVALAAMSAGIFVPLLWNLDAARPGADTDSAVVMVYMHERFWLVAGICLVLVALGALRLSHRIAGPLVRYKRNLRLLAQGRLPPPLRTRRRDYLKEEVACLNEAVDGVRERVAAIRAAQAALRHELERYRAGQSRGALDFGPVAAAERDLERSLAAFSETGDLDSYQLVPEVESDAPPVLVGPTGSRG